MKQKWSKEWLSSKQPRKQRKYVHNAPMHVKQKLVTAHLAAVLRRRFERRSLAIRKGDEVKVMRGSSRGMKGKVERVDLKSSKIYIEGLNVKKVDGTEVMKPFQASNLMITEAKMDDKRRQMIVERGRKASKTETKEPKKEVKAEEKKSEKKDEKKEGKK